MTIIVTGRKARRRMLLGAGRAARRQAGRMTRDLVDAVDVTLQTTRRGVRRGAYAVEDSAVAVASRIRHAPLRSVLLSAAAGVLIGVGTALVGQRQRTGKPTF